MTTGTQTQTYTVLDVRRVLDSFAADFLMLVQATGVSNYTRSSITNTVADLKLMAENGCIKSIDVILFDSKGTKLRAAKYTVSTSAEGWINQRPGANLWPRTPAGRLQIIVSYADGGRVKKESLKDKLLTSWTPTDEDTTHAKLSRLDDRLYVSKGWGLQRGTYG
jgi:hypothetical protein